MQHSFNVAVAQKVGVQAAILLNNFWFWVEKNRANNKNYYDGHYWTYNSKNAFAKLFPYMTARQIDYAIKKLVDEKLIITGNYNEEKRDRTLWYSITKTGYCILQNCEMASEEALDEVDTPGAPFPSHFTNLLNASHEIVAPLPDSKQPDLKQEILKETDTRARARKVATKVAPSLSQETKKKFIKPTIEEVSAYCQAQQYDVNPEEFINYYDACGWEIKKGQKIKDWRAAVRNWVIRQEKWDKEKQQKQQAKPQRANQFANFEQRNWDFAKIEQLMQEENDAPNDGIITNYRPEPNNTDTTTKSKPQQSNSLADMMRKASGIKLKDTNATESGFF